jgi:hypothetical protein
MSPKRLLKDERIDKITKSVSIEETYICNSQMRENGKIIAEA